MDSPGRNQLNCMGGYLGSVVSLLEEESLMAQTLLLWSSKDFRRC